MNTKLALIHQNEELVSLQTKFGNDVEDLRDANDANSKPLDIRILLTPLRDSCGNRKACVRTKLHIVCSEEYPEEIPNLSLEETKGISNSNINELLKMLNQHAVDLLGRAMIVELVQRVQAFLINQNKPAQYFVIPTMKSSHSRLKTEFEDLVHLGKGAFGDVLKAKNILDGRKYAIKRIPLVAKSQKLYKKMTREVELMSKLNHENVVRYFHSWIERGSDKDSYLVDENISEDSSESEESSNPMTPSTAETEKSFSAISKGFMLTNDYLEDDGDDGIEFVNSNGEVAVYDDESEEESDEESTSSQPVVHVMYIQMEFCGNDTLRTIIDRDSLRPAFLWRLFREILEGLCHIHKSFIIHRDLKPGNIFLDSSFRIKIGDFGQATTTFRAKKYVNYSSEMGTGTGEVGTLLYVAPELMGDASRSSYDQKADIYPLGIILYEMIHPAFKTEMERRFAITSLRHPSVNIPVGLPLDSNYDRATQIIRWLLNHDASKRPSATELLRSKLVPLAQAEVHQLDKVLRQTFAEPQGKAHKRLVAKCLQQKSDVVLQLFYHRQLSVRQDLGMEYVKGKVVNIFQKHGGTQMDIPLLMPISKNTKTHPKDVKLMTRSGQVVMLPSDLRVPFVWHVAVNDMTMVRSYSVDRVFKEKNEDHLHPEQKYKCFFDIITPKTSNHLIDAEVLSVACEIINEFPRLREQDIFIRLNHTKLLRAILVYCKVPPLKYSTLCSYIRERLAGRLVPSKVVINVNDMERSYLLNKLLLADLVIDDSRIIADEPILKCLLRGERKVSLLAKQAMRELQTTITLAKKLGVNYPFHVCPGLVIGNYPDNSKSIVWQMIAEQFPYANCVQLAVGERYDKMLQNFQKKARFYNNIVDITSRRLSGAGLTFSLDKLVSASSSDGDQSKRAMDVCVCVTSNTEEVTNILHDLWSAGIRTGIAEAATIDEAQERAKKLGAIHIILMEKNGLLSVRSSDNNICRIRTVTQSKLIDCIKQLLKDNGENEFITIQSIESFSHYF